MAYVQLRPWAAATFVVLISGSVVYGFSQQSWSENPPRLSGQIQSDVYGPALPISTNALGEQSLIPASVTPQVQWQIALQDMLRDHDLPQVENGGRYPIAQPVSPRTIALSHQAEISPVVPEQHGPTSATEAVLMPSVLENEVRTSAVSEPSHSAAALEQSTHQENQALDSSGAAPTDASLPEAEAGLALEPTSELVVAPVPEAPLVRLVETNDQPTIVANARAIVPTKDANAQTGAVETIVTPLLVPIPRPAHQRPQLAVSPRAVDNVIPVRSVSGDPMVDEFSQGSWPRRLDLVNARADLEDYVTAEIVPGSIFLSDWYEVDDEFGARLVPKQNIGD